MRVPYRLSRIPGLNYLQDNEWNSVIDMEIQVTPVNIGETILSDERFSSVDKLRHLVGEAKVLRTIQAEPFMWNNLLRRAFAALTPDVIEQIGSDMGIQIHKTKNVIPDRSANFNFSVRDGISATNKLRSVLMSHVGFAISRKEDRISVVAWR